MPIFRAKKSYANGVRFKHYAGNINFIIYDIGSNNQYQTNFLYGLGLGTVGIASIEKDESPNSDIEKMNSEEITLKI